MKKKQKIATILTVQNRDGVKFKIGDKVWFLNRPIKIEAFRTDTPAPNWLDTETAYTYWIMAKNGTRWSNIDFLKKVKR